MKKDEKKQAPSSDALRELTYFLMAPVKDGRTRPEYRSGSDIAPRRTARSRLSERSS